MILQSAYKGFVDDVRRSPVFLPLFLFSFSLPFGGNYNSFFLIPAIALFAWGLIRKTYIIKKWPPWQLIIPCILYLAWVAGSTYSLDRANALRELELKSSLFIFPVILYYSFNTLNIKKILLAFVAGCMFTAIFCLVRAFFIFLDNHDSADFVYSSLSFFMHSGYYAMYLIFSSLIIFLWNRELATRPGEKISFYVTILLSLFHYLMVVLLSTRSNIIALVAVFVVLGISFFFQKKYRREGMILVGGVAVIFLAVLITFNSGQDFRLKRIIDVFAEKKINTTSDESIDVRILIWRASFVIIKDNFWLGTGTGDAKAALAREYKTENLIGAEQKMLNAHNEFIQTFLAIGIVGFSLLLITVFAGLPLAISQRHLLLTCFVVVIVINFFTESMLERQAGIVFFAFFNTLLILADIKSKKLTSPNYNSN